MKILTLLILTLVVSTSSFAGGGNNPPADPTQAQGQLQGQAQGQIQGQAQGQLQGQAQKATAISGAAAGASSSSRSSGGDVTFENELIDDSGNSEISDSGNSSSGGNSLSVEENHPDDIEVEVRQLGTLVSQPNNNTSSCIKVWGIASGNKDIQGIFGIPQRDMQCDLDKAANDAFAQNNYLLGWSFKCNMKSIQKMYRTTYRRDHNGEMVVTHLKAGPERHEACMRNIRRYAPK